MNLLDQLYQYSLRSDSSSLSFSALENQQNMELSSISHQSFTQSMISSSLGIATSPQEGPKSDRFTFNFQENLVSNGQMEIYMRVKDKYRKLSKMVEMFGNKIRKIQYEFLVKLQNKYKDSFNFRMGSQKQPEQLKRSKIIMEISKETLATFSKIIQHLRTRKISHHLRLGFSSILKRSINTEKLQYLCCSLNSLLMNQKKIHLKHFFNVSKHQITKLKRNHFKELFIASKRIFIKSENPISSSFNNHQNSSIKIPIVYPQHRQIQNIDLCDNLSMFFLLSQQIFRNHTTENKALQVSIIKNVSQNDFKTQKRKSDLTNVSGTVSQVEECAKLQTQYELDQKFCYQVPLFGLSQSACFKECSNKNMIAQENQQNMLFEERRLENLGHRFSLEDHQSQLNKYISFRRSIEKKKHSTLKDIQKSKETIKKIVYELQKSKVKNEKQRIKLTSKKQSFKNKSSEKNIPIVQSKACSPIRAKTIGNKTSRGSSAKKNTQDLEHKLFTTRDNQTSENLIIEDIQQFQTASKNIEVYYNYMKAKKKGVKNDESSHKKASAKPPMQACSAKKNSIAKHHNVQNNLLIISKDSTLRGRRIDVKVDLTKPSTNGRLQLQKTKCSGKKSKK